MTIIIEKISSVRNIILSLRFKRRHQCQGICAREHVCIYVCVYTFGLCGFNIANIQNEREYSLLDSDYREIVGYTAEVTTMTISNIRIDITDSL